jgi:hypothetical protein
MVSESRFNIKSPMVMLFSLFFIIGGVIEVGYWAIEISSAPPHLPILGILSLVTAYFFLKMNRWSVPLVIALFLMGVTFGAITLHTSLILQTFGGAMLFHIALIVYMIILLIAFIYIIAKREEFLRS